MKLPTSELREALNDANIEVYQEHAHTIEIAERIRFHMMDSGVRISNQKPWNLVFTVRAEQSSNPHASKETLLERLRAQFSKQVQDKGYREVEAHTRIINHPSNNDEVLDIWYELQYGKELTSIEEVVSDLQWALKIDKQLND